MLQLEEDNENMTQALKRLKDEAVSTAAKFYKQRTPKKPTDLTSKVQLKKMVEELEIEIGMLIIILVIL
jgi:cytochrome c553